MFTRCPECETVFQIEIEELTAAEGKVCCGECDRVFNALVSLTETPSGDQPAMSPEAPAPGPQDTSGTASDEQKPVVGDLFDDQTETAAGESADLAPWAPDETPYEAGADLSPEQAQWERKLAELGLAAQDEPDDAPRQGETGTESPLASDEPADPADWLNPPAAEHRSWPWAFAAVLAGLALAGQSVHYWREDLASVSALQPWVEQFYQAVGNPLPRNWDVRAYLVEKGAVSDHPEMAGALLVNAVISNASEEPIPHPLLKVTLLDRWGEAIGERFFAPAEYLQDAGSARAGIAGGDFAEASVLIVDPGQGAVSYGIDVCLRDAGNRLACAHQDVF